MIQSIALLYQQAMHAKCAGQPRDVREYHVRLAAGIVERDFYSIEHICNGLNQVGKDTFCLVTGLTLPRAQGASREALREWCGVKELDDKIMAANNRLLTAHKSAESIFKENTPSIIEMIEGWYNAGFVELISMNKRTYLANRAKTQGQDLSTRGLHAAKFRPYLEAYLELQALRIQNGEITEPVFVTATPVAEPEPQPVAERAQQYSVPEQQGFEF
ncbi:hypothetical protein H8F21_13435 [Pseudomonas sp. P66]|uniref:Uncharacterized protein n=1 Tax=Pseudomonas arcuscaelestis TaxID=2710591 RepID=A0ABS2BY67_9PSED|nr:hypothetical protein [Pseudomonas arcuscaelestis]MBM5458566.1 hypothetical protein [Pseudomonas arcuscaelestis]